jgi:hypothetical protein
VKTYFLDPGIVSKAKRRRLRGSVVLSRGFIDPRNLEGKKDEKPDILRFLSFWMSESVDVRVRSKRTDFGATRRVGNRCGSVTVAELLNDICPQLYCYTILLHGYQLNAFWYISSF